MTAREADKRPSLEDMANFAVERVLRALGKGCDLQGEMSSVIQYAAAWGVENHKRHMAGLEAAKGGK